jgi:hypothetical protein
MQKQLKLNRNIILIKLTESLKTINFIYALWEGGAAAFNRIDQWSDIDLYILADDKKIDQTIMIVENTLISLTEINKKLKINKSQWPNLTQIFYQLKNASQYLLIDLVILNKKSPEKFLNPKVHGKIKFYFNKLESLKSNPITKKELDIILQKNVDKLKARFELFNIFIQKEINRCHPIEALHLYYKITLNTLIELLRIKHSPYHYNFNIQYISYEIPKKSRKKLISLSYIKNISDLQQKYDRATIWIIDLIRQFRIIATNKIN